MIHNKQVKLLIALFLLTLPASAYSTDIVRYNISENFSDPKQAYYIDLLELALTASKKKYGDYQLEPVVIDMPQGRTSIMVQNNANIDVVWRMTSRSIEQQLQAVYIPILKGLMGYRVFIIRKTDQALYPQDMNKQQLQQLLAGQGLDWPDSDILRYNGFNVSTANATVLLKMLTKRRFDYFPRALHEPWIEISKQPSMTVEENLLLKYPAPMYFFVSKENTRLHQRLSYGLQKIIYSARFEDFFKHHPVTSDIIDKANIEHRTVFELTNPLLSLKTQALLENEKLWFKSIH